MPLPSRCLATPVSRPPYCPAALVSLRRPGAALAVLHFSAASRPCTLHLFTFPPALHCRCPVLSACTAHTCAHTLHNHVPFIARLRLRTLRNRLSHVHHSYTALTHCLATAIHFAYIPWRCHYGARLTYTPDAVTAARTPLTRPTLSLLRAPRLRTALSLLLISHPRPLLPLLHAPRSCTALPMLYTSLSRLVLLLLHAPRSCTALPMLYTSLSRLVLLLLHAPRLCTTLPLLCTSYSRLAPPRRRAPLRFTALAQHIPILHITRARIVLLPLPPRVRTSAISMFPIRSH